jgi:DNA-binding MarR family transcriptional regulator
LYIITISGAISELSTEAINHLRQKARSVNRELGLLSEAYFEIGVTLAERLLLEKSTISRLISKAVKKGYIAC